MSKFGLLFRYELKSQLPFSKRKGSRDFVGNALSLLITLLMAALCVALVSVIAKHYVAIKEDKVYAPLMRARELINVLYLGVLLFTSVSLLERMRKTLTSVKDKSLFLRLPIKQRTIFLSKLTVLFLRSLVLSATLVLPVNIILSLAIEVDAWYWIGTAITCVLMPVIPFLVACIFIVPYIKLIDLLKEKYLVLFLLFSVVLVGGFWLYSEILQIVQNLLATGSIKFLFNEKFIHTLQFLCVYGYPANWFVDIVTGQNVAFAMEMILLCLVVAIPIILFVTSRLYNVTMYKYDRRKYRLRKETNYKQRGVLRSLMRKERISVFREPRHIFAYLSIAAAMPVMAYCCYTLFETLIDNVLGLRIEFALALFILLIFSVLTNTFCSTNVTREGVSALKFKVLPLSPSKILRAKIFFCAIVSSISVILTAVLLVAASSLQMLDGVICACIGVIFSFAQIFLATRLDLNHANVSSTAMEMEAQSSKTMAKVVLIGLILSIVAGISSVLLALYLKGFPILDNLSLTLPAFAPYVMPLGVAIVYFIFALCFYRFRLKHTFEHLLA